LTSQRRIQHSADPLSVSSRFLYRDALRPLAVGSFALAGHQEEATGRSPRY
jgi:hypothetical protein